METVPSLAVDQPVQRLDFPLPPDLHPLHQRELVEGPVRGCRLYREGYLVLHGSAVLVNGVCLSIVGPSGHGKSTLAAALCAQGAKLVSDGMTPVDLETCRVEQGLPRVKLSQHSIEMLGRAVGEFTQIHPASPKFYVPVEGVEETTSIVLSAVVCLDSGDGLSITQLSGATAAFRLLSNAYLLGHLPESFNAELFRRSAALANRIPVFTLTRDKVPEQLSATVQYLAHFVETRLRDPSESLPANSNISP